jgi:hypothetical protein
VDGNRQTISLTRPTRRQEVRRYSDHSDRHHPPISPNSQFGSNTQFGPNTQFGALDSRLSKDTFGEVEIRNANNRDYEKISSSEGAAPRNLEASPRNLPRTETGSRSVGRSENPPGSSEKPPIFSETDPRNVELNQTRGRIGETNKVHGEASKFLVETMNIHTRSTPHVVLEMNPQGEEK